MASVMADMENLVADAEVAVVLLVAWGVVADAVQVAEAAAVVAVAGAAAVSVAGAAAAVAAVAGAAASVLVMLFSLNNKIPFRVALY